MAKVMKHPAFLEGETRKLVRRLNRLEAETRGILSRIRLRERERRIEHLLMFSLSMVGEIKCMQEVLKEIAEDYSKDFAEAERQGADRTE